MKTLYISDLDGTLLAPDASLSPATERILKSLIERGAAITFATARTEATALSIVKNVPFRLPAIFMNGVVIRDAATGELLLKNAVPEQTVRAVEALWREYGVSGFVYRLTETGLTTYFERLDTAVKRDFVESRRRRFDKPFAQVKRFSDLPAEDTIYFCLLEPKEKLEPLAAALRERSDLGSAFYRDVYHPGMWFLEVYSAQASKFRAVRFLQDRLHPEETVGFGDNLNDLPLFRACDRSYAVANADSACREQATGVIGSNDEDGVARFLEEEFENAPVG